METNNIHTHRQTATNSLAVVGFVALLVFGVWGAVYSARFVPGVVNGTSSAAVYLGSIFSPAEDDSNVPDLAVVPNATSTIISFGDDTPISTSTPTTIVPPVAVVVAPQAPRTITVPITIPAPAPHGLADFMVQATVVGYLTTNSTNSFVASTIVPSGSHPAVKFTVKNIGTNWSGTWRFTATIPTRGTYTYTSDVQPSVGPNGTIDYVLGFDREQPGTQQSVVVHVNDTRIAPESDYTNNRIEFKLNIQ